MSAIERSVIEGNVNWDLKMTSDIQRCPFQSVHYIETLLCRFDRHFIRPQEKYLFREVSAIRRFYCGLLRFRRTLVFQMHSKKLMFSPPKYLCTLNDQFSFRHLPLWRLPAENQVRMARILFQSQKVSVRNSIGNFQHGEKYLSDWWVRFARKFLVFVLK